MTADDFDINDFNSGDIINITFNDGKTEQHILYRGTVFPEIPEIIEYYTNNVRPAIPARVLVLGKRKSILGINVSEIKDIAYVSSI